MDNNCTELANILEYYRKEIQKNRNKIIDCKKNIILCMLSNASTKCTQWQEALNGLINEKEEIYKYYNEYVVRYKENCMKSKDINFLPEECKELVKEYNTLINSYEKLQNDYFMMEENYMDLGEKLYESQYELYRCIYNKYCSRPYLYFVKNGDTLFGIAQHFNTTVEHILDANVICDPDKIQIGLPLIIPVPGLPMPTAGGTPYYIVRPGDTINCIAKQFNTTADVIMQANQIENKAIYSDSELLITNEIYNPKELYELWTPQSTRKQQFGANVEEHLHELQYNTTFKWAALGEEAIPYLLNLLYSHSAPIRYFTLISLGRIARNQKDVISAVSEKTKDWNDAVARMAELVLKRTLCVQKSGKRLHILTASSRVYSMPDLKSNTIEYLQGTEIMVLRWHIPSPTIEIEPASKEILVYDEIKVLSNNQIGFLPRNSFNEITFI